MKVSILETEVSLLEKCSSYEGVCLGEASVLDLGICLGEVSILEGCLSII